MTDNDTRSRHLAVALLLWWLNIGAVVVLVIGYTWSVVYRHDQYGLQFTLAIAFLVCVVALVGTSRLRQDAAQTDERP